MSGSSDRPYLKIYPELEIFELLLAGFVTLAILANLFVAGYNIFLHAMSAMGLNPDAELFILTNAVQDSSYTIPQQVIDLVGVAGWVLYAYILAYVSSDIVGSLRRSVSRLRNIRNISYSITRLRRVVAHFIVGQLALLATFYTIFVVLLLVKSHFAVRTTLLTGIGFFFAFAALFSLIMTFAYSQTGQSVEERFFEVIGGYPDGEIGRELHTQRETVTEVLSEEQLKEVDIPTGKD